MAAGSECKLLTRLMAGMSTEHLDDALRMEEWPPSGLPEHIPELAGTINSDLDIAELALELDWAADTLEARCRDAGDHRTAGNAVNTAAVMRSTSEEIMDLMSLHREAEADEKEQHENHIDWLKDFYNQAEKAAYRETYAKHLSDTAWKGVTKRLQTTIGNIKYQDGQAYWDDMHHLEDILESLKGRYEK